MAEKGNMKVFLGVSLRAAPQLKDEYAAIYECIQKLGHENLSNIAVKADPDLFYMMTKNEIKQMNVDLAKKIHSSDLLVIEATTHSLTMGYYIKMALDLNKPVIVMHLPGKEPFYFSGIENDRLQIIEYSLNTLSTELGKAIYFAKEKIDLRFNLFISPELNNYLKWIVKKYDIQKSHFIRLLIKEHMEKHKNEYELNMKE